MKALLAAPLLNSGLNGNAHQSQLFNVKNNFVVVNMSVSVVQSPYFYIFELFRFRRPKVVAVVNLKLSYSIRAVCKVSVFSCVFKQLNFYSGLV